MKKLVLSVKQYIRTLGTYLSLGSFPVKVALIEFYHAILIHCHPTYRMYYKYLLVYDVKATIVISPLLSCP